MSRRLTMCDTSNIGPIVPFLGVEQGWSKGGAKVEQGRSKGGARVEGEGFQVEGGGSIDARAWRYMHDVSQDKLGQVRAIVDLRILKKTERIM